jgi:hypothetical protein
MNARAIMQYLVAAGVLGFAFGVVREDESVLAFGTVLPNGGKVRLGSISHVCGDHFLVLSMDSTEEYRADTLPDLYWFLWRLEQCQDWALSSDWVNDYVM